MSGSGDQAFLKTDLKGRWHEMTYGGAVSFLRRCYSRDLDGVDVAVMGVPFDNAVTYRPGTRLGPRAIRAASVQLAELKAFPWGFDPFDTLNVVDFGDVMLDPHHPETVLPAIRSQAAQIIATGAKLLTLGGDHSIAYPLIKAHAEKHGPIALIQIDAHCDTWEDDGVAIDHGTMFARATVDGIIDPDKSTQIGLRTYNDSDHGFEILSSPWIHRHGIHAAIDVAKERAGDAPVYVSFDIDGLDPAFAPGTGTPVAGGLASWQGLEIIRSLGDLNLVGMDVVEVSPPFDTSEITALVAAHLAHDWLCVLAEKAGAKTAKVGRT
ncbi:agmatinase [Loktanella sp. D2R18]|uniref:agmatinase n=1 Tax=Rhodobacterales TaxID=204455 RepID=UPI000DE8E049|nr:MULTISPECIES: agmatinase [Rhodobacterales]MDO6590218.1 agmatinase [Yoonia sp. 1_MG-2023]RBW42962.1 agmatinase [Loktanella sp. D2R18]